jgi:hypothetical protein
MLSAPMRDIVTTLVDYPSLTELSSFFHKRMEWHSYPIIHERMMSSGVFDDLVSALRDKPDQATLMLNFALELSEEAEDKYVLGIVYLIAALCTIAPLEQSPSEDQMAAIRKLYYRVKNQSFVLNLSSFWEKVCEYCARKNELFETQLSIVPTKQPDTFLYQVKEAISFQDCPIEMSRIREHLKICHERICPEFWFAVTVSQDTYWVFRTYMDEGNNVREYNQEYLLVNESKDGRAQIIHRRTKIENQELLCQDIYMCHYSPWEWVS